MQKQGSPIEIQILTLYNLIGRSLTAPVKLYSFATFFFFFSVGPGG
jgi:hypothetical protein